MLNVPDDFAQQYAETTIQCAEATVIEYQTERSVVALPVLVGQPTFVFVTAGTKQVTPHGSEVALLVPTASVLFMRSGAHSMSEFGGESAVYASIIFSVKREFLKSAVGLGVKYRGVQKLKASKPSQHAAQLFQQLGEMLRQDPSEEERQFKLRELLIALMADPALRKLVQDEAADLGQTERDKVVSVVTRHYLSPLQVADFAKLCAMSLSSFKRHFLLIYNASPAAWFSKQRMGHARKLIAESELSITKISEVSGYRDVATFVRAFRRHFGCTPTSCRGEQSL